MNRNDMEKTITFSIHEEDRDRERRQMLRAVYDALVEKGHKPIDQLVGYILTDDPTYITNYKNARGMIRRIDRYELIAALLKEYLGSKADHRRSLSAFPVRVYKCCDN